MARLVERAVRFDPFELQDGFGVTITDPYPRMAELARQSPVHVGPIDLGAGTYPVDPSRPAPVSVLSYDECTQVLRDAETYSSSVYEGVMGEFMGATMLQMDDPAHRDHRLVVSQAFRSQTLVRFEETVVRAVVNELIDEFAERRRADLVRTFTFHFPVQVIARILGLPRADYPRFQRWALEITSAPMHWERGLAASAALRQYFARVLAERRARPADDLISLLAVSEVDGRRLEDEEIYSFLRLLLPAGVETTYRASGNLLFGLLHQPDQLQAVREDRSLIPRAIEEGLRWEPPVTVVLRRATVDTELAGVAVAAGSDVGLLLGAANHDRRRWADPDRFDVRRPARAHVAFGFGIHVCLGMHLARMETRIALECLLDRLPGLRLDPEPGTEVAIRGLSFRSPIALPVCF
jgi:cytochrome P450